MLNWLKIETPNSQPSFSTQFLLLVIFLAIIKVNSPLDRGVWVVRSVKLFPFFGFRWWFWRFRSGNCGFLDLCCNRNWLATAMASIFASALKAVRGKGLGNIVREIREGGFLWVLILLLFWIWNSNVNAYVFFSNEIFLLCIVVADLHFYGGVIHFIHKKG